MASDAFTNTNFTTLPTHDVNWVVNQGTYYIFSNAAYGNDAGSNIAGYTGQSPSVDQSSEIVVGAITGFVYTGVGVHIATDGSANCYFLRCDDGTDGLVGGSTVSGTSNNDKASSSESLAVSDTLRLEVTVSGSTATLTAFINDVEITSGGFSTAWTDTDHTSGDYGVTHFSNSSASRATSWEGLDLGGGGGGTILPLMMSYT